MLTKSIGAAFTLDGPVNKLAERAPAEHLTWVASGVTAIHNLLTVKL